MNGHSKAWAGLLLGIALVLGGVAGATIDHALISQNTATEARDRRDGNGRRDYIGWLSSELQLTPDQRTQVEAIVERHRELVSNLWREMRPQYEALREQARGEIKAVLTEEQLKTYEALLAREAERHQNRRGRDRS